MKKSRKEFFLKAVISSWPKSSKSPFVEVFPKSWLSISLNSFSQVYCLKINHFPNAMLNSVGWGEVEEDSFGSANSFYFLSAQFSSLNAYISSLHSKSKSYTPNRTTRWCKIWTWNYYSPRTLQWHRKPNY